MAFSVETSYASYQDITEDVMTIRLDEGYERYGYVPSGRMEIDLNDPDGLYGYGGARSLEHGTTITIRETSSPAWAITYYVTSIRVNRRTRISTVICVDRLSQFVDRIVSLPLVKDGTVQEYLVGESPVNIAGKADWAWSRGVLEGICIIDYDGRNEINNTVILGTSWPVNGVIDTSRELPYIGDLYAQVRIRDVMRDLCMVDGGRIVMSHGATFFYPRTELLDLTSSATIDLDATDLEYEIGGDMVGAVEVLWTPRSITTGTDLYTSVTSFRLEAGSSREFRFVYRNDLKEIVGAENVVQPELTFNTQADGLGLDYTQYMDVFWLQLDGSAAVCRVVNPLPWTMYIDEGFVITGDRYERQNSEVARAVNPLVYHTYRGRTERINARLVSDESTAQDLANYEVARRSSTWAVRWVGLRKGRDGNALTKNPGEMVTVTVGADSRKYFVQRRELNFRRDGMYYGRLDLEPAAIEEVFTINLDDIDGPKFIGW